MVTGLPEVVELEGKRLGAAQAALQRVLVTTAALLLLRQAALEQRSTWSSDSQQEARKRLGALLADPGTRLPHIATELARLSGVAAADSAECEARMSAGLSRLLSRSGGAFKVWDVITLPEAQLLISFYVCVAQCEVCMYAGLSRLL